MKKPKNLNDYLLSMLLVLGISTGAVVHVRAQNQPEIISPDPLWLEYHGSTQEFVWTPNASPVIAWRLTVGPFLSIGPEYSNKEGAGYDYYADSGIINDPAQVRYTVENLPTSSKFICVNLYWLEQGQGWQRLQEAFYCGLNPGISDPSQESEIIAGEEIEIWWNATGHPQPWYILDINDKSLLYKKFDNGESSFPFEVPSGIEELRIKLVWPGGSDTIECPMMTNDMPRITSPRYTDIVTEGDRITVEWNDSEISQHWFILDVNDKSLVYKKFENGETSYSFELPEGEQELKIKLIWPGDHDRVECLVDEIR